MVAGLALILTKLARSFQCKKVETPGRANKERDKHQESTRQRDRAQQNLTMRLFPGKMLEVKIFLNFMWYG